MDHWEYEGFTCSFPPIFLPVGEDGEGYMDLVDDTSFQAKEEKMERFEPVKDWKQMIYNLLVDHYNNPEQISIIKTVKIGNRDGFAFNPDLKPDKKIAELYAAHVKKVNLEDEDPNCIFVQDLYTLYSRAAKQLMAKYFTKYDGWTFLYCDVPLFVPGEKLQDAQARLRLLETRQRKLKKNKNFTDEDDNFED